MSLNRYAVKRDDAEHGIVQALEAIAVEVWVMDYPCDLACRRASWPPGVFQLLEVKTGRGKKLSIAKDRRQKTQQSFIASTGTPIVRTPMEAINAINSFPLRS
jgi:hypothetical protein